MFRPALRYVAWLLFPRLAELISFLGSEVDLDLGNYERYLAVTLTGDNNITTGKIYQHVRPLE